MSLQGAELLAALELALEQSIDSRDACSGGGEGHKTAWHLYDWEANGLCIALRLAGDYEGVTFNSEWAAARKVGQPIRPWLIESVPIVNGIEMRD